MQRRFQDTGQSLYDFQDTFLVECPRCKHCAEVGWIDRAGAAGRRLACGHCGYVKEGDVNSGSFDLPLWLQIACCGEDLWAYNVAHLDFLESYVRADLREAVAPDLAAPGGLRNGTLASRLPPWIKSAHNRADILRCIAKLRKTIE